MVDSSLPPTSTTNRTWHMKSPVKDLTNLSSLEESLSIENVEIPSLKDGQVLVQVACCTINDEDRLHLQNAYVNSANIELPRAVGFEGSGKVVASKAPWYLGIQIGTRVAFYASTGDAMVEYLVCDAKTVIPIPKGVSYSNAAAATTNPFTVLLMVNKLKRQGVKSVINTVGAGALGRVFTKYAKSLGITVIALVRRDALKEMCSADGAKFVINMKDIDFDQQLQDAIHATNCRFAYDGLGGDMPDRLLQALPNHSIVSIYSEIVSSQITIDSTHLYHEKHVEAFNAAQEQQTLWIWQLLGLVSKLQQWMADPEMTTTIRTKFDFDKLPQAVRDSVIGNKSDGKVQLIINPLLLQEEE